MLEKKFTKGSWRINAESNGDLWIDVEHKTEVIANVCCGYFKESRKYEPTEEELANAKLISAAPDLLEACLAAFFKLTSSGELNCEYTAKILEKAIDKALGVVFS